MIAKLTNVSYDKTRDGEQVRDRRVSPDNYVKAMDPVTPAPVKKEAAKMPTSSGKKHSISALNPCMGVDRQGGRVKGNIEPSATPEASRRCALWVATRRHRHPGDPEGRHRQVRFHPRGWQGVLRPAQPRPANKGSSVSNEYEILDGRCEIELCVDGDADVKVTAPTTSARLTSSPARSAPRHRRHPAAVTPSETSAISASPTEAAPAPRPHPPRRDQAHRHVHPVELPAGAGRIA